jgi:hypothetical protein
MCQPQEEIETRFFLFNHFWKEKGALEVENVMDAKVVVEKGLGGVQQMEIPTQNENAIERVQKWDKPIRPKLTNGFVVVAKELDVFIELTWSQSWRCRGMFEELSPGWCVKANPRGVKRVWKCLGLRRFCVLKIGHGMGGVLRKNSIDCRSCTVIGSVWVWERWRGGLTSEEIWKLWKSASA